MNINHDLIDVSLFVSLSTIVTICICRINATQFRANPLLRIAYITLATGAFSMLYEVAHNTQYSINTAILAAGVALCFATDRRQSLCYSNKHPIKG